MRRTQRYVGIFVENYMENFENLRILRRKMRRLSVSSCVLCTVMNYEMI